MRQNKNTFRHESLQDAETIQDILKSISKGLGKGKLTFGDSDGEILLTPAGLLNLKVKASQDEARNRIDIRISWLSEEKVTKKKPLNVKSSG